MIKICKHCNASFNAQTHSDFCCSECRENYYTKTCPICGKRFRQRYSYQITCSRECGKIHKQPRRYSICKHCGEKFLVKSNDDYCSMACKKGYKMKGRKYMKNLNYIIFYQRNYKVINAFNVKDALIQFAEYLDKNIRPVVTAFKDVDKTNDLIRAFNEAVGEHTIDNIAIITMLGE